MVAIKNKLFETTEPGTSLIIRATPKDSDPKEPKYFYIVDLIRREGIGSAAYTVETVVIEPKPLAKLLGCKKNERLIAY